MAGNAGFGGVQRHFHPARHPGLRADPAGEERPEGTAPLPPPGSGEHPSSPSAPFFFFSPPPGPGHHQSRPHEEDPAGHQGAQQPALGWWQHRGGHLGPRCLLCVCVCGAPPLALLCLFVPQRPWSHCFSPSPRGWRAPERSFGPCQQPGWRGHYRSQGAGLQCGAKSRDFFPLPQKNSLSPDGYLSCVNIWRRDIYCCCWRGVIASGKEGRGGAGPFQQRPQEPHTPFYKKYTNILLTFLHRFFFPPPPSSSKNNPFILFFFFLCTACSQSRTPNYLQAMYRGRVSSSASPPTSACPGGSFWPPQRRAWKEKQGLRARQSPPPA